MKQWIWFDMDGTIADLYGVKNWLNDLVSFNTRPYENAKLMYNQLELIRVLAELRYKGYNLGIISWGSKAHNSEFDTRVEKAKREWLKNYCLDFLFDEIVVTQYGINKSNTCQKYGKGILIDDEKPNRDSWELGKTINANENILEILEMLLAE